MATSLCVDKFLMMFDNLLDFLFELLFDDLLLNKRFHMFAILISIWDLVYLFLGKQRYSWKPVQRYVCVCLRAGIEMNRTQLRICTSLKKKLSQQQQ